VTEASRNRYSRNRSNSNSRHLSLPRSLSDAFSQRRRESQGAVGFRWRTTGHDTIYYCASDISASDDMDADSTLLVSGTGGKKVAYDTWHAPSDSV